MPAGMGRNLTNVGLGTGAFVGFAGSVVETILERLGLVETAVWLYSLVNVWPGLNWQAIWFIVFVFCVIGLFVFNFDVVVTIAAYWFRERRFMSGANAVSYIAYWSELGDSWSNPERPQEALNALKLAVLDGKIAIKGRKNGRHEIEWISREEARTGEFAVIPTSANHHALAIFDANKKMLFSGILVDQEQVIRTWRNSRPTNNFLGWSSS